MNDFNSTSAPRGPIMPPEFNSTSAPTISATMSATLPTRPDTALIDELHTLIDEANRRHLHAAESWLREVVGRAEERLGVTER